MPASPTPAGAPAPVSHRPSPAAPSRSRVDAQREIETLDEHGRLVQAMFSDIAPGYDRANRLMSMGTDVRWRRRAVDTVLPESLAETARAEGRRPQILDLCAGTLDSTMEIHRRHPDADLVGGDFSLGMLQAGEKHLSGAARARIEAKQMDAHDLPEPDGRFDGLFCAFGVRNLSDLPRGSREMFRVLRPGGRLTVLEFFRPASPVTRLFHGIYNRTVLPVVGWACTGNLGAYLYLPKSIGAFERVEDYAALLEQVGFVNIQVEPLTMGVASIVRATKPADDAAPAVSEEAVDA